MEIVSDLLKILIPAALVLYGMYLTAISFINCKNESLVLEGKNANKAATLPIRLQAYERICLLLERISPNNLLLRLNGKAVNVADFQQVIVNEIREEFNHNLSQQVYMSDEAWNKVRNAVEHTISTVNEASMNLDSQANGIELSKGVLNLFLKSNANPCENALLFIKNETRNELF